MTNRKFFVGGNWKMNGNKQSIDGIAGFLKTGPLDPNTGMLNGLNGDVHLGQAK